MIAEQIQQIYQQKNSCETKSEISTESQDFFNESLMYMNQENHPNIKKSKIKSSLCRNFAQKNYCPYGEKCQFAHGLIELKCNTSNNKSYKTRSCHSFLKKQYCFYGYRCNFIHRQQPLGEKTMRQKWSKIYQNHRETIKLTKNSQQSRLLQILKFQ